jgi:hypothetical protein
MLRALTHNIMILWIRFSTEQAYPLFALNECPCC